MGRFRKFDVTTWDQAKFRALSAPQPCAQFLLFYLLTNRHTTSIPGCYRATEAAMADELGWDLKGFRKGFAELSRHGFALADFGARLVWLPDVVTTNLPENPNVVKGWATHWAELPDCGLKLQAWRGLKSAVDRLGPAFAQAFSKGLPEPFGKPFGEGSANQEQEQEQEYIGLLRKPHSVCKQPEPGHEGQKRSSEVNEVFAHYRAAGHPRALRNPKPASKEWRAVVARLEEGYSVAELKAAIDGCHRTPHNLGDNERGQRYLGLELIMRSASQVDRFAEAATQQPPRRARPLTHNEQVVRSIYQREGYARAQAQTDADTDAPSNVLALPPPDAWEATGQ